MLQMWNPGSRRARRLLGAALLFGATASTVNAQWTVIDLHPPDPAPFNSYAVSVQDGQQVGYIQFPGTFLTHASLWNGTAASWVDLNPAGATESNAVGISNGRQAGGACCFAPPNLGGSDVSHPFLWSGTAASWVDFNSANSISGISGMSGDQLVGSASFGPLYSHEHAVLWAVTTGSMVDLHPASTTDSIASGTDGTQQVGYAYINSNTRASLWTGTAGSWVNLHPNAALASRAVAVDAGQQVGWASYPIAQRAHLWTGTKNSLVNLHPAGASQSWASGVHAGQQVGAVTFASGAQHASLWSGTAASWVDLHAFLPPQFNSYSEAFDIWHSGNVTYVVGDGYNTTTQRYEALMWVFGAGPAVWTDLGSALPGVSGLPQLGGTGTLVAGDPMSLALANAAPSALAVLFLALSSAPTPFKGGTLVPVPPQQVLSLATTSAGTLQIPFAAWPAGASGLSLYFQYAIQDASAVHGVALSNALRANVP